MPPTAHTGRVHRASHDTAVAAEHGEHAERKIAPQHAEQAGHGDSLAHEMGHGAGMDMNAWRDATRWLAQYGSFGLFAISALPLPQTPALIFAGIYRMPVPEVWLVIFLGKVIKYGIYAGIVSAFPGRYSRRYASLLTAARHANQAVSNGGSSKGKSGDDRTPKHAADVP